MRRRQILFATVMVLIVGSFPVLAQNADPKMSFFLVSSGPGNGANFGGLEGADRRCQLLARSVGAGDRTWHAYLSTTASGSQPAVHARDRIGNGPWYNSRGVEVARDVAHLHSDDNNLTKETQLSEQGQMINGRGDSPNRHDILTGSQLDGTVFQGATCGNWTGRSEGGARVGHHDRTGGGENPSSWNSAHTTRGCSQENLQDMGGDGLFYCFAID